MADLKRLTEDATTKAAIAVGRDAAKRAVAELLAGDEKPTAEPEKPADPKRRWKLIAWVVLGVFLVVGLIGLLLNYWVYFLAAGVLGVLALFGWSRLRTRMASGKTAKVATKEKEEAPALEPVRVIREKVPEAKVPEAGPAEVSAEKRRAEAEAQARALAEAQAVREHEVDEELAAMKARLKR